MMKKCIALILDFKWSKIGSNHDEKRPDWANRAIEKEYREDRRDSIGNINKQ